MVTRGHKFTRDVGADLRFDIALILRSGASELKMDWGRTCPDRVPGHLVGLSRFAL